MKFEIQKPERVLKGQSAWQGLESILADLIKKYNVGNDKALEFGVEYGYSTVALSNFFKLVIGVDTFKGDEHSGHKDTYEIAKKNCDYKNIILEKCDYREFESDAQYDLIHVDIVHTYEDTFKCGEWACVHSDTVIFHDTESFPEVKRAVEDLAKKHDMQFDNYPHHHGLGILHRV